MSRSIRPALEKVMRALAVLPLLLLLSAICASAATFEETYQQAQAAYKAGDFAKAGALFVQAGDELQKKKDPRAGLLWGNGAIALMKAKDYAAAADTYERILGTKNPPKEKLQQYYSNLVLCRAELNQRALEIEAIDRMLKAIPKLAPADLAEVYARQGDAYRALELYGPAAGAYDKAAHVLPKDARPEQRARIFNALGLCQGNMGDYANAEKSLTEARALAATLGEDLTMAESDSNLGILHWERGDYPEAMKLLSAALERETAGNMRAKQGVEKNNIGLVHLAAGNHAKAMDHFEDSLALAKEATDTRGEAIATVNKALVNRIAGQLNEARSGYKAAAGLFDKAGFQEGQATTMLGVGKMAELEDKNYTQALENYLNALKIYEKLDLPRWQAVALLQLGSLHKRMGTPERRTTRDLVFDDEPTVPDMPKDEALAKARAYYSKSLAIGEKLSTREVIWKAHQGLGYLDFQEGKLEPAFEHYQKAIDLVSRLFVSLEDVQLLGEFMADKEDLYNEAQELCAALYDKTKDKKYLDLQMRYADTLRNEVQKAATALLQLNFEDKKKQKLYEELQKLGRANAKAAKAIPVVKELPADADANAKAAHKLTEKAAADQKARVQKLDGEYNKLLAEWKKEYKNDALIFDATAERVNISAIQKQLKPDQAAIQYISLPKKLLITVIKQKDVQNFSVDAGTQQLKQLIMNGIVVDYIHNGFKKLYKVNNGKEKKGYEIDGQQKYFDMSTKTLSTLYNTLIQPVEDALVGVDRLYIIADGYLSQIPFTILVCGEGEDSLPIYLVEKYEIANIRPSFISALETSRPAGKIKKMLAVANPDNKNFPMGFLPGTIEEVKAANEALTGKEDIDDKDIALEHYDYNDDNKIEDISSKIKEKFPKIENITTTRPTEPWLREHLDKNKYEIIYFATHGQTQSDTYTKLENWRKEGKEKTKFYRRLATMRDKNLAENTPLNGFIYLSSLPEDQVLDADGKPSEKDIPRERDGLLTIREILNLDDKALASTRYVLVSACNAAVSLIPFSIGEGYDEKEFFDPKLVERDLRKAGLLPGVDQATFVESFMRRGVQNVFATYWQLEDDPAGAIMSNFWSNIADQGDKPDLVTAYAEAQRKYLAEKKQATRNSGSLDKNLQPYMWGAGGIFGK